MVHVGIGRLNDEVPVYPAMARSLGSLEPEVLESTHQGVRCPSAEVNVEHPIACTVPGTRGSLIGGSGCDSHERPSASAMPTRTAPRRFSAGSSELVEVVAYLGSRNQSSPSPFIEKRLATSSAVSTSGPGFAG